MEYKDINVEVRRSSKRRTVDLIVDRGGDVVIAVPHDIVDDEILKILREKEVWLYQTLRKKRKVLYDKQPREYVSGEGFYYLGKNYRLKIFDPPAVSNKISAVSLRQGRFWLARDAVSKGQQAFIEWYTKHADNWIRERMALYEERVGDHAKDVKVMNLGFRWASCGKEGTLNFNWRIILLPPEYIRYLILHELVHLHEHSHGSAFYDKLRQVAPDYECNEQWLQDNGDRYDL